MEAVVFKKATFHPLHIRKRERNYRMIPYLKMDDFGRPLKESQIKRMEEKRRPGGRGHAGLQTEFAIGTAVA